MGQIIELHIITDVSSISIFYPSVVTKKKNFFYYLSCNLYTITLFAGTVIISLISTQWQWQEKWQKWVQLEINWHDSTRIYVNDGSLSVPVFHRQLRAIGVGRGNTHDVGWSPNFQRTDDDDEDVYTSIDKHWLSINNIYMTSKNKTQKEQMILILFSIQFTGEKNKRKWEKLRTILYCFEYSFFKWSGVDKRLQC